MDRKVLTRTVADGDPTSSSKPGNAIKKCNSIDNQIDCSNRLTVSLSVSQSVSQLISHAVRSVDQSRCTSVYDQPFTQVARLSVVLYVKQSVG